AAYGDHPYGRLETSASLAALDRAAVVDFHRRTYRPGRALFVVAGDIAPERAAELLEDAFAGWSPGAPAAVEFGLPPLRHRPRVVLVHRTGADRAVLRVGHTVGRGDHDDWTALTALSRLLGGGPSARLFRIFRDERGLGPAAWTEARRRLDRGYVRVAAETRTGDVVAALAEVRAQLLRVRQEPVAMDELRETRDFLAGAFPLRLETPLQLATELATGRLLGLPDTALSTYRARVSRLDPADLQEVALRQIQPDELVYVVVGDARWYHDALTAVGDVTVVDPRGRPVAASALRLPAPPDSLDAGGLRPARAEYRVLLDGRVVGTVARTLERGADGTMTYRGVADLGPQRVEQSVTFTVPGFEPRAARTRAVSAELVRSTDVRVERGRLVGTVRDGGGVTRAVDRPFPEGAMITDMTDLVVWIAALEPGSEFRMSVVDVDTGAIRDVAYRVAGIEDVELPGGTVRAYRVEMEGADPQTVWARIEAPHVPLRIRSGDGPLVLELTSWTGPGPPPL
ncbi:MAG TPA: insulinase family protein, partial [Longimicrobiales bacterium]|nr:insulinase family protein [Longimicrobiales bacterium]